MSSKKEYMIEEQTLIPIQRVALNSTREHVISIFGEPLQEVTKPNSLQILVYGSSPGLAADYVYLQDRTVVLVSESYFSRLLPLSEIVSESFDPSVGYMLGSAAEAHTDTQDYVFLDLEMGLGYQVSSNTLEGSVYRVFRFQPGTPEQSFLEIWGQESKILRRNVSLDLDFEEAQIDQTTQIIVHDGSSPLQETTQAPVDSASQQRAAQPVFLLASGVFFLIAISIFIWKIRHFLKIVHLKHD